ncbi:MAG: hypothetical protein COW84_05700 [Gammaproteobacteria bacterium CG22_combo_CG10-13_8_21_14_all_40_8]|nr:MAG: hypothetical protein COW84_05700 [Gammaproteobacteria bacterium CG22_combo_CG10-13_8_21_14_all_40_8]
MQTTNIENTENLLITKALTQLIAVSTQGNNDGFVVFTGEQEFDFVQYSQGNHGLSLYWPLKAKNFKEPLLLCKELLDQLGYQEIFLEEKSKSEVFSNIRLLEYIIVEDGLYAEVGTDAQNLTELTIKLLDKVYQFQDLERLEITLELD